MPNFDRRPVTPQPQSREPSASPNVAGRPTGATRRRSRGPSRTAWLTAVLSAVMLLGLGTFTAAAATPYTPKCDDTNLRTGPTTSHRTKARVDRGDIVTVVKTVSRGYYGSMCKGRWRSGYTWHKITAINGRSVSSLYGVSHLWGAKKLLKVASMTAAPTSTPTPTPTPTIVAAPTPTATPTALPTAAPTTAPSAPSPDPGTSDPPGASPGPTATPTGPVTLPDSITFYGRGWGHGVGLSQYGAHGRALAGQSADQILDHYYQGTTSGSHPNVNVRVLVLEDFAASPTNPVQVFGRGGEWTIDGIAATFPADARLKFIPTTAGGSTSWSAVVNRADGTVIYNAPVAEKLMVRPGSGASLQLWSKPSAYDRFRGTLRIVGTTGTSPTVKVINHLPLESYLQGVLPAEVSASWPAEAIKAQAVAARSYAARRIHPESGSFDLYDDTRHQVYRGLLAEKSGTNNAVAATAGGIRLAPNGSVANALFHSTGGGATENNEYVFVSSTGKITSSPVSYLRGSIDRTSDGTPYDAASNLATWKSNTYSLAQIQAWYAADSRTNVGTLVALDLRDRGVSGRLISVTLIGADGTTKKVSGGVFIGIFNSARPSGDRSLRSTLFDLAPIP